MFDQISQNLMVQSGSWISAIFSQAVLRQVAAFLVILVTAWLLQFLLRRLLYAWASRFVQTSWTRPIIIVIDQALLLIMALILSLPVLVIFRTWGWTDTLLVAWLVPLLWIWLLYRLVGTLLSLNLAPTPARLWSTKVALPLLLLIWLFNGLGLLDEPPPSVQFQGFAGGSLNFDLLVWTGEPARIPVLTSDLRYGIWDTLAVHHIEMDWPQSDIHIHLNKPESDNPSPTN